MAAKSQPASVDPERLGHLEQYVRAWLRTHALRMSDLGKAAIWDLLLKTLSKDLQTLGGKSVDLVAHYVGLRVADAATGAVKRSLSRILGGGRG